MAPSKTLLEVRSIPDNSSFIKPNSGTGIKNEESGYTPSHTRYNDASPGVGAVLIALAEMILYQEY